MSNTIQPKDVKIGSVIYKDLHWVCVDKIQATSQQNGTLVYIFEGQSLTTREKFGYESRATVAFKETSNVKIKF